MDFFNAYLLSPPGSIVVALLAIAFFVNEAWPRLSRQKKTYKLADSSHTNSKSGSGLSVIKEPEVPEGWWNGRDIFELERRALFSKVSLAGYKFVSTFTYHSSIVMAVCCPSNPAHKARSISII